MAQAFRCPSAPDRADAVAPSLTPLSRCRLHRRHRNPARLAASSALLDAAGRDRPPLRTGLGWRQFLSEQEIPGLNTRLLLILAREATNRHYTEQTKLMASLDIPVIKGLFYRFF